MRLRTSLALAAWTCGLIPYLAAQRPVRPSAPCPCGAGRSCRATLGPPIPPGSPLPPAPRPGLALAAPVESSVSHYGPAAAAAAAGAPAAAAPCVTTSPARPARLWWANEALLWWQSGAHLPPLVTAAPGGTPFGQAGVLGAPGTATLFGADYVNTGLRGGWRTRAGAWLDDEHRNALEGEYLTLGNQATAFAAGSGGDPILARPFINSLTGGQAAQLVAFPGLVSGNVAASAASSGLVGAGGWLRHNWLASNSCVCDGPSYRLDTTLGYRYLRLSDHLGVSERLTDLAPGAGIPPGTVILLNDRFSTLNEFHGADFGLIGRAQRGRWYSTATARLAVGANVTGTHIAGATTVNVPGVAPLTQTGGLQALASNIGGYHHTYATAVPELGLTLGYQLTPRLRVYGGYTFLYWFNVLRAGDQLDPRVNPNLLPTPRPPEGPIRPLYGPNDTEFWAQGINLGMELRY